MFLNSQFNNEAHALTLHNSIIYGTSQPFKTYISAYIKNLDSKNLIIVLEKTLTLFKEYNNTDQWNLKINTVVELLQESKAND